MKTLTDKQVSTLLGLLRAVDEADGLWPTIEKAIQDEGIDDADEAMEELRTELYS